MQDALNRQILRTHKSLWLILLITICCSALSVLIQFSKIGLEISDISYYLLNYRFAHSIEMQLSQFGTIWTALFGQMSVHFGRVINIFIVFLCFISCTYMAIATLHNHLPKTSRICFALLAGLASLNIFSSGILDFTYNTATYLGTMLTLCCFLRSKTALSSTSSHFIIRNISFLFIGFSLAITGLSKPQSGLLLAFLVFFIFFLTYRNELSKTDLIKVFGLLLLGVSALFLLIWLRVKSPITLGTHMIEGYLSLSILKAHEFTFLTEFKKFVDVIENGIAQFFRLTLISKPFFFSIFTLMVAVCMPNLKSEMVIKTRNFLCLSAAFAALYFGKDLLDNADYRLMRSLYDLSFILLIFMFFMSVRQQSEPIFRYNKYLAVVMLFGFIICLLGTTSSWGKYNQLYIGLTLAATIIVISGSAKSRIFPLTVSVVFMTIFTSYMGYNYMTKYPYRYENLTIEKFSHDFGSDLGHLLVSASQKQQLTASQTIKESLQNKVTPHSYVDLTGASPGIALYLGLNPGPVAWQLGGYKGSDKFLQRALSKFSDDMLLHAVYAVPLESENGLNIDILNNRLQKLNYSFPDDFEKQATYFLSHMDMNVGLFVVKNELR